MFTDINRAYPKYEVYCLKFWALITGIFSTLSLFMSLGMYSESCVKSFPDVSGFEVCSGGRGLIRGFQKKPVQDQST